MHTHDGRVVGDPLPLALGVGVESDVVPVIEAALVDVMLHDELVLAVARVADRAWEMYYVLTSHHFTRVAFDSTRSEARYVSCSYEHARTGMIEIGLDTGDRVNLGPLAHARDAHLIASALSNIRLPHGSDGRRQFVDPEPVRTGVLELPPWTRLDLRAIVRPMSADGGTFALNNGDDGRGAS